MEIVRLTEAAQIQGLKLLGERIVNAPSGLRIAVVGNTCGGPRCKLGFDTTTDEDRTHEYDNGLKVMVDEGSAVLLEGCSLEYHEAGEQSAAGFEIINPNAAGCGGCNKNSKCKG